ncbi:MAG TPA: hypothetical protein VES40_10190 [Ilumatobacteraceae bacterium]|nr:hypothetical protein [Ilumatobacteraceae bacterium]
MDAGAAPIGRASELAELDDRLASRRLVTVIGPGGVGKTTMAVAGARRVEARYPHGTRFVDLARVQAPDAVAGAIAAQIGFTSFEALLAAPPDQAILVIVDNCEHVLDAAAEAIGELLESGETPTVLATSRSPLDLPGESVMTLAPLPLPDADDPDPSAPSVLLFLARAKDAGAQLGHDDLDTVARVIRRLDGLPLAIEIAAARTRSMTIADLCERLDAGVGVLDRPRFRGSERHRSVTDLVRWSIDLLSDGEADLLGRIALLPGRFTADDAAALVTDPGEQLDLLAGIETLVHASLVSLDRGSGLTGYRVMDTVRACALEHLREQGSLDHRADQFVDRIIARVWARLAGAGTRWDHDLLHDVAEQYDHVATALRWTVDHDREPDRSLSLTAALFAIVQQGRALDIVVMARRVAERWPGALDSDAPNAPEAWGTLATAENLAGDPHRGIELAEQALAASQRPTWAAVTLRRAIAQSHLALGDRVEASSAFIDGARHARRLGLTAMAIELELADAQIRADAGDVEDALAVMTAARREADAIRSAINASWASTIIAWTTVRGDAPSGIALARAALDEARAIDYPNACAGNLRTIAYGQLLTDEVQVAAETVADLLSELRMRGSLSNARLVVDVAALVAHRAEHPAWRSLSATVPTLPPSTVLCSAGFDLTPPLGDTAGMRVSPLSIRDALRTVATVVADVVAGATAGVGSPGIATATRPDPVRPDAAVRRRGDVWEFDFAGRSVSVRTSKGIADIAALLAADGREVHCLDLVGAGSQDASTGEVIDATARRQYEQRIRDLQAEIDDAEAANDHRRAERAQAEFDALVDHLTAALGHGGKARRASGTVERARSTVTQRMRTALRHIEAVHPELGRHLQRSIRTGIYCRYAPEHATSWLIESH